MGVPGGCGGMPGVEGGANMFGGGGFGVGGYKEMGAQRYGGDWEIWGGAKRDGGEVGVLGGVCGGIGGMGVRVKVRINNSGGDFGVGGV